MKVGFTGSRHGMTKKQKYVFGALIDEYCPDTFHHGVCEGADEQAHNIVREMKPSCFIEGHYPTDDSKTAEVHCDRNWIPAPYLTRNKSIVNSTDLLIAIPNTFNEEQRSGTWSTVRFARKLGKQINIILPDGRISSV